MKLHLRNLFSLATLVALTHAARAQYAAGASFTAQRLTLSSSATPVSSGDSGAAGTWVYGPTIFIQHEHGRFVKFGFDARAEFLSGSGLGVRAFDVGPRLAFAPRVLPIKIYGEILIGGAGIRTLSTSTYEARFDVQEVVGVDFTVLPHVDWRVLEYDRGESIGTSDSSSPDHRDQLSTGIVLRF
jgi:hypothetical protein